MWRRGGYSIRGESIMIIRKRGEAKRVIEGELRRSGVWRIRYMPIPATARISAYLYHVVTPQISDWSPSLLGLTVSCACTVHK